MLEFTEFLKESSMEEIEREKQVKEKVNVLVKEITSFFKTKKLSLKKPIISDYKYDRIVYRLNSPDKNYIISIFVDTSYSVKVDGILQKRVTYNIHISINHKDEEALLALQAIKEMYNKKGYREAFKDVWYGDTSNTHMLEGVSLGNLNVNL